MEVDLCGDCPLIECTPRQRVRTTSGTSINDSELDIANEVGNMGQDIPDPNACFNQKVREQNRRKQWQLNYQEAAIYLQEGQNNDKFYTHPQSHEALPAYQVAHNHWFYMLDMFAALVVMLLAASERPAVAYFELPVGIHGSLEMLCLLILSLDLGIRFKWLRLWGFIKHRRTLFKAILILLMLVESIVVLVRQTNHFRVTRALRPLFLLHTHYCQGVRRITRQIMQSMPPILDMIILLLFFMLIFSILGFYLFSGIKTDTNFKTIQSSFISLFVLLTTANYPDVMMAAYNESRFSCVFFIIYLSLELYFLMNLLLAVVYDTFSNLEKSKIRSLFFHKREGCMHAFRLLVTQANHSGLSVKHFIGMMGYFLPKKSKRDYYLMFKALNTSKTGMIQMEEFFNIYEVSRLRWKLKSDVSLWSSNFRHPCNIIFKSLNWLANWKYLDYFIYFVIAGNFLWILIETARISSDGTNVESYNFTTSWISISFICIYSIEAVIKILGRGPYDYFTRGWDLFDFLVTLVSVVGVFGEIFENSFYYVMILRPFRLLRLFKLKKRYRDVLGTLFVLFSKLMSLAICIIIVYYFYAIIGMEFFLDTDLKDCCQNTSVESAYAYKNGTAATGYYYMNNFDNIFVSGVTLFELTVVNNWFIIMEGYANAVSQWTRIYFMSFYIVMMVVMNIVVAFVLESFIFRINYRRQMQLDDIDDHGVYKEEITLTESEMHMVTSLAAPLTGEYIRSQGEPGPYVFRGEGHRTREDFSLRMYHEEVEAWSKEFMANRHEVVNAMQALRNRERPNTEQRADNADLNDVLCVDVFTRDPVRCVDVFTRDPVRCVDVFTRDPVRCVDVFTRDPVRCVDVFTRDPVRCVDVFTRDPVRCVDVFTRDPVRCVDVFTRDPVRCVDVFTRDPVRCVDVFTRDPVRCVDVFTRDPVRCVDVFTRDPVRCVDVFTRDPVRCVDVFTRDPVRCVDVFTRDPVRCVDVFTRDPVRCVDVFTRDPVRCVDVFTREISY
nr:two pore calcium channel protein 1-like [Biomphalaria glabrata]